MQTPRLLSLLVLALAAPGAAAGTLFVDAGLNTGANDGSSWANAFQGSGGLQDALGVAVSGDDIYVKQGTYLPSQTGLRTDSIRMATGVGIYGGFLGTEATVAERPPIGTAETILSGDLAGNDGSGSLGDNSHHVVRGASAAASAILDGFTITGGNANVGGGNNDRGGGLITGGGAAVTIQSCRFLTNRCTFGGGAVYISNSAPTFTDCTFENNVGGAFGGAFDIAQAGAVQFDRCRFLGNSAARAGALEIFATSGVVVSNSLFTGNTATGGSGGGAIWMGNGGNTRIVNCSVIGNSSPNQQNAGLRVQGGSPTVVSSIFYDNAGPGGSQNAANQIGGTTNVTYCIVEGGFAGVGNSGADPQLVGGGDFTPGAGSPALDAGNNAQVPAGIVLDLGGNPRFVDDPAADTGNGSAPLVDIGAIERQGSTSVGTPYCFGDGTGAACPCNNTGAAGAGCANGSFATGSTLSASGTPSVANDSLVLSAVGTTPSSPGIFFQGDLQVNGGLGTPFGDGLRCAGNPVMRTPAVFADASGNATSTVALASTLGINAGQTKRYQWWYRDAALSLCGNGFNVSNGLEVVWQP